MKKIIDLTQKKMLRGRILQLCYELQSTGAGVPVIHAVLKQFHIGYTQDDIVEACHYLQGKELITFKHVRSDELDAERDIAYITSEGIDVLDGTKTVEGIL